MNHMHQIWWGLRACFPRACQNCTDWQWWYVKHKDSSFCHQYFPVVSFADTPALASISNFPKEGIFFDFSTAFHSISNYICIERACLETECLEDAERFLEALCQARGPAQGPALYPAQGPGRLSSSHHCQWWKTSKPLQKHIEQKKVLGVPITLCQYHKDKHFLGALCQMFEIHLPLFLGG